MQRVLKPELYPQDQRHEGKSGLDQCQVLDFLAELDFRPSAGCSVLFRKPLFLMERGRSLSSRHLPPLRARLRTSERSAEHVAPSRDGA